MITPPPENDTPATNPTRDTVLLSHANPEDNEFTLWLGLQLANEGYKVWCDLTKLLGGKVFWDEIEDVIRTRAAKVLFVLSRTSNAKDGPLRELHLAQSVARREKLKDFVIPLHIDDLPYGEVTIELTRINATPFENSWRNGLATLLQRLEEHNVPKSPSFNRTAVNEWWRSRFSAVQGLRYEEEEYLSNWFPITSLPEHVYFHSLARHGVGKVEVAPELPYPAFQDGISLITFAPAADFDGKLGPGMYIAKASGPLCVSALLSDKEGIFGKHLFRLLRIAWEHNMRARGLPIHELANEAKTFYFVKDRVPADKVFFTGVAAKKTFRGMVGYSTRTNPKTGVSTKRYWHFGLEGRPQVHPELAYIMKPHVLFSNDGTTIWKSKDRLAAARQSQCKGWWNDDWRDRTLAAISHLTDDSGCIRISLGSNTCLTVAAWPLLFYSPVAYTDPQDVEIEDYGRTREEEEPYEDAK